jgi:hypothetical protein
MRHRHSATTAFAVTVLLVAAAAGACTSTEPLNDLPSGVDPSFVALDGALATPEGGLVDYCPSSECPLGHTTCPNSVFRCDVNLLTDTNNCGACGVACPADSGGAAYSCVNGRCALTCVPDFGTLDCNGIVDDGCETTATTNDNCGFCGNRCADPTKPCAYRSDGAFACGCPDGELACPYFNIAMCINVEESDENCGACGHACDPTGVDVYGPDAKPPPPNMYYGCHNRQCGQLKCTNYHASCDTDVLGNGCETALWTDDNCLVCNNHCPGDQFCAMQPIGFAVIPGCVCAQGLTYCGTRAASPGGQSVGRCYDLTSDDEHCGACDVACPGKHVWAHAAPTCEFGRCTMKCFDGWGDCNGNVEDDCEVHTDTDPNNCGGCGIVCDAVAGQACAGGQCVVAPCGKDGGLPR